MAAIALDALGMVWLGPSINANSMQLQQALQVNSAAQRVDILFTAQETGSLSSFKLAITNVSGSPTAQADVYAVDSNYIKTGAALATATPSLGTTGYKTITITPSLTAGVTYILEIQNTHATPASNNFTIGGYSNATFGINPVLLSTDSGSTYVAQNWETPLMQVFGSNTYAMYTGNDLNSTSGSIQMYNTSGSRLARFALKLILPYSFKLGLVRVPFRSNTGSPTFQLGLDLIDNSGNVLASSSNYKSSLLSNVQSGVNFFFDDGNRPTVAANTPVYVAATPIGATAGDASNCVNMSLNNGSPQPTSPLGPFRGSYYSTASGTPSWTQQTTAELMFGLGIIPVSSGGGAPNLGLRTGGRL